MSALRASLLKKRQQQAAQPQAGAGAEAAAVAAGEDPQTAARYGKLKQSAAAQAKSERKFFDSADRNTVGLPAASAAANGGAPPAAVASSRKPAAAAAAAANPSTLASPNGNPSLAQLTIGGAGSSTAGAGAGAAVGAASPPGQGRGPINKHIDKIKGAGATGVDAADTAAHTNAAAAAGAGAAGAGGAADAAPGPGVGVPVTANVVGDDGVGTLKAVSPAAAGAGAAATATSPGTATGQVHISSGGKAQADILLVEDVRVSQRIAQVALQRARFKVDVASTAEEAIEKFKTGPFKIVLMDIQLPQMNGMEATQIIRDWEEATEKARAAAGVAPAPAESKSTIGFGGADVGNHPRSLIFGLTGAVEEENLRQYRAVGMNGCIAKGKLLATAVKTAIEKITEKPSEFVNLVSM